MKKQDLKKLIKPIVKECIEESIHEALFDSGIVTSIVAEVMEGMNIPQLVESMVPKAQVVRSVPAPVELVETRKPAMSQVMNGASEMEAELQRRRTEQMAERASSRSKLEEMFKGTMGTNIFEGTTPVVAETSEAGGQGPLSGVDPSDPGIDLTAIPGLNTLNFKGHLKE